jgi:hypothetical protein
MPPVSIDKTPTKPKETKRGGKRYLENSTGSKRQKRHHADKF